MNKNFANKVKMVLSSHAKKRLMQRFRKENIGKIYERQIIPLTKFSCNKKAFYIPDKNMIIIRNTNSKIVVTVLTIEMWNKWEFSKAIKNSFK